VTPALSRVVLDDELLVELERHLLARRLGQDEPDSLAASTLTHSGICAAFIVSAALLKYLAPAAALPDLDPVADLGPKLGMLVGRR
jgi:hypothetical protein